MPNSSIQIAASNFSVSVPGASNETPSSGRLRSGAGKTRRSSLPLEFSGSLSSHTKSAGSMYSGSLVFRKSQHSSNRWLLSGSHQIGYKPLVARNVFSRAHDSFANVLVLDEERFNLPGLDAEAADLHLLVNATQVLKFTIGEEPCQIPCTVEARSGLVAERMRNKPFGGLFRTVYISAGEACATHE